MTINIGPIKIEEVSKNSTDWKVIKDEKYRPDKGDFILKSFKKDFSHIQVTEADKVYSLCSRSTILGEWLANKTLEYAKVEAAPTYYRDNVSKDEYLQASKQIDELNNINREKTQELLEIANDYRNKVENIESKYNSKVKALELSGINLILTLKTTDLPLSILLAIENFTPSSIAGSPSSKTYAREMLVNYKVSLIKYAKANPSIDINKVIQENKVK